MSEYFSLRTRSWSMIHGPKIDLMDSFLTLMKMNWKVIENSELLQNLGIMFESHHSGFPLSPNRDRFEQNERSTVHRWDLYDWDVWTRVWSETYIWHWYDWDPSAQIGLNGAILGSSLYIGGCLIWLRQTNPIETDMSETRLARRVPKFFWSLFLSVSQSQVCRIDKQEQIFWALQSYLCKFGLRRLESY